MKFKRLFGKIGALAFIFIVIWLIAINLRKNLDAVSLDPAKTLGNPKAKIYLLEFSDFYCGYCAELQPILRNLLKEFPDSLRIVFKHYPLKLANSKSPQAALAAECAAEQGKFEPYHQILFERSDEWFKAANLEITFIGYARELQMSEQQFKACFQSQSKMSVVNKDRQEGEGFGIRGTPTLILNGIKVIREKTLEGLRKEIMKQLPRGN